SVAQGRSPLLNQPDVDLVNDSRKLAVHVSVDSKIPQVTEERDQELVELFAVSVLFDRVCGH
ncbi:MAG: hypothetical protein ACKPHU_12790, partial [Planctomycetaceae bacterium]